MCHLYADSTSALLGTNYNLILRPIAANLTQGQPPVHHYCTPSQLLLHSYLLDDGISGVMPSPVQIAPIAMHPASLPTETKSPNVGSVGLCAPPL